MKQKTPDEVPLHRKEQDKEQRILEYIRRNNALEITAAAKELGFSPQYVSNVFGKHDLHPYKIKGKKQASYLDPLEPVLIIGAGTAAIALQRKPNIDCADYLANRETVLTAIVEKDYISLKQVQDATNLSYDTVFEIAVLENLVVEIYRRERNFKLEKLLLVDNLTLKEAGKYFGKTGEGIRQYILSQGLYSKWKDKKSARQEQRSDEKEQQALYNARKALLDVIDYQRFLYDEPDENRRNVIRLRRAGCGKSWTDEQLYQIFRAHSERKGSYIAAQYAGFGEGVKDKKERHIIINQHVPSINRFWNVVGLKAHGGYRSTTEEEHQHWEELLQSGMSFSEIAESVNKSRATIASHTSTRQRIKSACVTSTITQQMQDLRNQGYTGRKVAEHFGYEENTVYRHTKAKK